jgi:hypothetical protein
MPVALEIICAEDGVNLFKQLVYYMDLELMRWFYGRYKGNKFQCLIET